MSKRGFTLLELLVVIAVISLLAALLLPNLMGVRDRARDSERKSDLRQIQKTLEIYKQDQLPITYPASLPAVGSCWSSGAGCTGTVYMAKFPGDPNKTPADYYFARNATDNMKYTLCACLENKADADSTSANCDDATYVCASGKSYVVNQP